MEEDDEEKTVDEWTISDVSDWLVAGGFNDLVHKFEEQEVDGKVLLMLTEEDLRGEPLTISKVGLIKRMSLALRKLQEANVHLCRSLTAADPVIRSNSFLALHPGNGSCSHWEPHRIKSHNNRIEDPDCWSSQEDDEDWPTGRTQGSDRSSVQKEKSEMKPEAWKAVVAMAYFFCVTWITAFVMVFVHDRVPDMATYPPLPDIFLDNVPLIPWAFQMCELCGLILFLIWCSILIFHKHRFILLRRYFCPTLSSHLFHVSPASCT